MMRKWRRELVKLRKAWHPEQSADPMPVRATSGLNGVSTTAHQVVSKMQCAIESIEANGKRPTLTRAEARLRTSTPLLPRPPPAGAPQNEETTRKARAPARALSRQRS